MKKLRNIAVFFMRPLLQCEYPSKKDLSRQKVPFFEEEMQAHKPIICLASWYPNELDTFEGDFIQRKLRALSLQQSVQVFHVKKYFTTSPSETSSTTQTGNLTETIKYVMQKKDNKLNSLLSYWKMWRAHQQFLTNYKKQYGKPDCVLVQVPFNAGIIAYFWKKLYSIPYILTEHYGIYNTEYEFHFRTRSKAYQWWVKKIVSEAKLLVTVSDRLAANMNNWLVKKEHVKISNVVDTDLFYYKKKNEAPPFIFCHLSNMIPLKNVEGMIRACAILKKSSAAFKLKLYGAQRAEQIKLAEELGLLNTHIEFNGTIPYEEVASVLHKAHCLLMNSNTESQSCISLEALCTGTPVISSKAGGIEEHLNSSNSLLVEKRNDQALASGMQSMMDNYSNYQLKEIASTSAQLYNYNKIGAAYYELIQQSLP